MGVACPSPTDDWQWWDAHCRAATVRDWLPCRVGVVSNRLTLLRVSQERHSTLLLRLRRGAVCVRNAGRAPFDRTESLSSARSYALSFTTTTTFFHHRTNALARLRAGLRRRNSVTESDHSSKGVFVFRCFADKQSTWTRGEKPCTRTGYRYVTITISFVLSSNRAR